MNPAVFTDCTGEVPLRAKKSTHMGIFRTTKDLCSRRSKTLHLELKENLTEHESWQLKGRKIKATADTSSGRLLLYLSSTPRSADPVRKA